MSTLFISHSSQDNGFARALADGLANNGYESLFLDFDPEQGIRGGQSWERTLYRKLRACDAVLVCFSDNHQASKWCFAEIALARMEGKQILTFLVDPLSDVSQLPPILAEHQYLDLRGQSQLSLDQLVRDLGDLRIEAAPERRWKPNEPPYPGMMAFDEKDAPIFFGREEESREIVEKLNAARRRGSDRVLTVVGASGSGKSSVVRAGAIPRLRRDPNWLLIGPFRPGKEPFENLAARLATTFGNEADPIAHELRQASLHRVIARLRRTSDTPDATPLVIVDQFEELLEKHDEEAQTAFLRLLDAACASDDWPIHFLITLRSDFTGALHRRHDLPALLDAQTSYSVGPMKKGAVRKVITEPAKLGALELGDGLVDELLKDAGTPDALPLLAFALRLLWDRGHEDHVLSTAEYAELGGLGGAVAEEAEAVRRELERKDPDGHAELPAAFARMVRHTEDGGYARAPTAWSDHPTVVHDALGRFVKNRLLVSGSEESGVEKIEIAHEALLRHWERLKGWLDERSATLELRDLVRRRARLWEEQRDDADLLSGARLTRAEELVEAGGWGLTDGDRSFVARSRAAEFDRSRKEGDVMGMLLSSPDLRERIVPRLRELVEEELAMKDEIVQTSVFGSWDLDASRKDQDIATYENIETMRWHPQKAEYIGNTGASRNYLDVYQFPCCGTKVHAEEVEAGPVQFRADGCQSFEPSE